MVKYIFRTYCCKGCKTIYGLEERFRIFIKHGWNLVSYLIYYIIEFSVPQRSVIATFNRLFGCEYDRASLYNLKSKTSRYYAATKQAILKSIVNGKLVHADETRANIRGKGGYVWVLTNMREVFYFFSRNREAETIHKLLPEFRGVLVSDFYSAYDSLECPQQRCLIHLIRDLNEEVLNNPFDEQLKQIVTSFADLLKAVIETVDRHGLKKYYLRKHLRHVTRFYRELKKGDWKSEAALKCKDRFERNHDKLFTFLNFDGIPWNNNNAEHAIKAFARLRDVLGGTSTEKGTEEYLILLSICQTCKYQGLDFLDFLRSGETDIATFAKKQPRRRRKASN